MAGTEGSGADGLVVSSLPNIGGKQVSETGAAPSGSPTEPATDEAAAVAAAAAAAVYAATAFAGDPQSANSGLAASGSSGRRTSRVWLYFSMIDNYHYACKLCTFVGTYTNTTNMRKHIQHHHPERYQDILDHTRHISRPSLQPYCLIENQQQQQLSLGQPGSDQLLTYRPSDRTPGAGNYPNYLHMQPHVPFSASMQFEASDKPSDVKPFVVGHNRFTNLHGPPSNPGGGSPPESGNQMPPAAKRRFEEPLPKKYETPASRGAAVRGACGPRPQSLNVRNFHFSDQEYLTATSQGAFPGNLQAKYKHFAASHPPAKLKARSGNDIFESSKSHSPDGVVGGGGQRSLLQDDNGELSSGGSVGLSGIEAVVAAAAAAAAAAGDPANSGGSGGPTTTGDGQMMLGGGAVTPSALGRDNPPAVGMSPPSITSPSKPESYQLRHNNHLSLVLNQLAEDEAFMDVTLTAEGRPVKAHKSVLSAVSPYFSSVLRANPCQHPIIIMPHDVRFAELSNIIMYIYKGEMTVSAEELPSLLKTAELLRITGLSPGENSSSQQSIGRTSVTANSFAGLFNGSMSSSSSSSAAAAAPPSYSTAPSSESVRLLSSPLRSDNKHHHHHHHQQQQLHQQDQQQQHQGPKKGSGGASKPLPVRMDSPAPESMLNPSDFMDLDMTCVKEEMNSDCEEEDEDAPKSPTPKEVTTPPPVENPLSSDSRDRLSSDQRTDPDDPDSAQPNLEAASDDITSTHRQASLQSSSSTSGHCDDSDADIKRNSLKTLANLASLDTPTNLSPCDDSSSSSSVADASDVQPNICPYCSEYVAGGEISSHLSTKHAYKPAFVCSGCLRVFTRKALHEIHAKDCKMES